MSPPRQPASGAGEIGFTVVSISLSLVAVFIPILLMGGIVGRLFREVAVTLTAAIVRLDDGLADDHADDVRAASPFRQIAMHGRIHALSERAFAWVLAPLRTRRFAAFSATSARCCSSRSLTMAATVYLYVRSSERILPAAGYESRLNGPIQADQVDVASGRCSGASVSSLTSSCAIPQWKRFRRYVGAAAAPRTPHACSST